MTKIQRLCIIVLLSVNIQAWGQRIDSVMTIGALSGDTVYMITENRLEKNRFFGNSWYADAAYNLARTNEFHFNIGRTYGQSHCGGGGCIFRTRSWGGGYAVTTKNDQVHQLADLFAERTFFWYPPASVGLRADYLYDLNTRGHYIRPSAGLHFLLFDIFYNYTFNLSGGENIFKHVLTFRLTPSSYSHGIFCPERLRTVVDKKTTTFRSISVTGPQSVYTRSASFPFAPFAAYPYSANNS